MNKLIKTLKDLNQREQFFPSLLGLFLNPFYFSRKELLKNLNSITHEVDGTILDIGCGTKPYRSMFNSPNYIGLEIDTPEKREQAFADYFYEGKIFPFADNQFDSIVSFQVFEHIEHLDDVMKEIQRVLRPGGKILITVPFVWEEHETPYDFRRFTSYGLISFLEKNNFKCVSFLKSTNGILAINQIINAQIEYKLRNKIPGKVSRVLILLFASLLNLATLPFSFCSKTSNLYIDNIILASKN